MLEPPHRPLAASLLSAAALLSALLFASGCCRSSHQEDAVKAVEEMRQSRSEALAASGLKPIDLPLSHDFREWIGSGDLSEADLEATSRLPYPPPLDEPVELKLASGRSVVWLGGRSVESAFAVDAKGAVYVVVSSLAPRDESAYLCGCGHGGTDLREPEQNWVLLPAGAAFGGRRALPYVWTRWSLSYSNPLECSTLP